MSYAEHKTRVFQDAGDLPLVLKKRSEGRIKSYPSATDARAWCPYTDERRQHILDLIRADHEKCALGKYVPIEVLIDTLLANKNADIEKLRQQVEELQALLDMYAKLDLTEDQKRMLGQMQQTIGKAGDKLESLGGGSSKRGGGTTTDETPTTTDTESPTSDEERTTGCGAMKKVPATGVAPSAPAAGAPPAQFSGAASLDGYSPEELKELVIQKDAEVISLKNALAAKTEECEQKNKIARAAVEQLETLRNIMQERDCLREELEASKHEIETLRSRVEDPCIAEITELEHEIVRLQEKGQLSPEDEAEIIRKELEVLKKHCARLCQIKEDNNKLARELRQIQELDGIRYEGEEIIPPDDCCELTRGYIAMAQKLAKLSTVMDDRDRALQRIEQLETELLKYEGLPEELEDFKRKSVILDEVMDEREDLMQRLNDLEGLNDELKALKEKADRVDEMERLLGQSERASQDLHTQKKEGCKDLENIKAERDMLKMKVADLATVEEEIERLRYRAKEAEVLRIERDRLKIRLDELAAIECEFMQLLDKTRCLETIRAEREMYKSKYEELLGLECECDMLRAQLEKFKQLDAEREALKRQVRDCECCIADQEDEIKRLVGHVDRLTQGSCQQQDRMQKALCEMRVELEEKSSVIATSEEQLACVQDQLKTTIAGVSCETTCLRARIEDLEAELEYLNKQLLEKQAQINTLNEQAHDKDSLVHSLHKEKQSAIEESERSSRELEQERRTSSCLQSVVSSKEEIILSLKDEIVQKSAENIELQAIVEKAGSFEGDEHLEAMLNQSKCAVSKVAEELGKQYQNWDCMKDRLAELEGDEESSEEEDVVCDGKGNLLDKSVQGDDTGDAEAKAKLAEQGDRLAAENSALRRHSTEVQDLAKEQIAELVAQLKAAHERIAELEAGGDDALRSELESLRAQLQKEMQLRQDAEAQLGSERGAGALRADTSMVEIDGLRSELDKEKQARAALEAQLAKLQSESQQVGASAQRRTSKAEDEIKGLGEQHAQCLKDKAALESENASLKQQLESMKGGGDTTELDALKKERDSLLAQIESQKKEIADLVAKIGSIPPASGAAPGDLDKERQEKENMQNMIAQLQGQITSMQSSAGGAEDMLAQLQAQLKAEQAKTAQLQSQLEGEKIKTSETQTALEQLGDVEKLKERLKELEAENSALKAKLAGGELRDSSSATDPNTRDSRVQANDEALEELRRELKKQKEECADSIAALKAKYENNSKTMQNKYNDGIAKLQGSHEDVLREISEVYENQVDALRGELRSSKEALRGKATESKEIDAERRSSLSSKTLENVNIKPDDKGVCVCGSTMESILKKIMKSGMENLTYEELQFLHTKTCDATARLLAKRPGAPQMSQRRFSTQPQLPPTPPPTSPQQAPPCGICGHDAASHPAPQAPAQGMDQLMMLKTISGLENDLLRKQQYTEQKISSLQSAVKVERQRLEDLKATLENEKQLNSELMCKIGVQSRTVSNLKDERDMLQKQTSYHEDQVRSLKSTCDKSKSQLRNLEEDLSRERTCCRHMKNMLDSERQNSETMRLKLEKSLNSEMALKMQLEQRTKSRKSVCPCRSTQPVQDGVDDEGSPSQTTTTFYTELTIQDVRKKRDFVHHCCTKQQDQTPECDRSSNASSGRRKRSSSTGHSKAESLD